MLPLGIQNQIDCLNRDDLINSNINLKSAATYKLGDLFDSPM